MLRKCCLTLIVASALMLGIKAANDAVTPHEWEILRQRSYHRLHRRSADKYKWVLYKRANNAEKCKETDLIRRETYCMGDMNLFNFRSMVNPNAPAVVSSAAKMVGAKMPDLTGLDQVPLMASGQFTPFTWKNIVVPKFQSLPLEMSSRPLVVVNLRGETHGFINDASVYHWAPFNQINKGKDMATVDGIINSFFVPSMEGHEFSLWTSSGTGATDETGDKILDLHQRVDIESIASERDFVRKHTDASYVFLPVADRDYPSDEVMEAFVEQVVSKLDTHFFYVHCKAGSGRTMAFSTLIDIAVNAGKVPLADIMLRQRLVSPTMRPDLINLRDTDAPIRVKAIKELQRLFLEFYKFILQYRQGGKSWTKWIAMHRAHDLN